MTAAVSLQNVSFRYAGCPVLEGFSFSVDPGEVAALLGPSGCGKTTVLRLILGFIAPETGTVRLGGEEAGRNGRIRIPPEERGLAVVFQDLALWPHLTVHGNLAFGLRARHVPRTAREDAIAGILARVGLSGKERRYPGDLSGGERQRVAIARALVLEPRAVLFDEPLSNLDVGLKREILTMFRDLCRERGTTAIYVTHDLSEAAALDSRIIVMEAGRIVQEGMLDSIRKQPASDFVRSLLHP